MASRTLRPSLVINAADRPRDKMPTANLCKPGRRLRLHDPSPRQDARRFIHTRTPRRNPHVYPVPSTKEKIPNAVAQRPRPVHVVQAQKVVLGCSHVPKLVVFQDRVSLQVTRGGARELTIVEIMRLRVACPPHHGKLDLLEALALEARALLEPLLRVGKRLALSRVSARVNTSRERACRLPP